MGDTAGGSGTGTVAGLDRLEAAASGATRDPRYDSIGGWLFLLGFGVLVSPLRLLAQMGATYPPLWKEGMWAALTTPGGEHYHSLWAPILVAEIGVNLGMLVATCALAWMFLARKAAFRPWYVGLAIFSLVFILVDAFAVKIVLPDEPVFDPDTIKGVAGSLVAVLIWAPYVTLSERAKQTFVR